MKIILNTANVSCNENNNERAKELKLKLNLKPNVFKVFDELVDEEIKVKGDGVDELDKIISKIERKKEIRTKRIFESESRIKKEFKFH